MHFIKSKVPSVMRCTIILCKTKKEKISPVIVKALTVRHTPLYVFVGGKKCMPLMKFQILFPQYLGLIFFK